VSVQVVLHVSKRSWLRSNLLIEKLLVKFDVKKPEFIQAFFVSTS